MVYIKDKHHITPAHFLKITLFSQQNTATAKVSSMRMLIGFAAVVMLLEVAAAVDHTVGGPNGAWDLSTDLSSWASSQTFTVGDNLVFQFDSSHDVVEVNEANYDSCGLGNPISTTVTSPTTIPLSDVGSRYFVCGRGNHCNQGMKVQINVVVATGPAPPQSTTPSSPTTPAPTGPSSSPPPPATGENVDPPSSAMTLKMTVGTMLGFGFLMMMLLSL